MLAIGSVISWNSLLSSMDLYVKRFPSFKPTFTLIMPLSFGIACAQLFTFFLCPMKGRFTIRVVAMFVMSLLVTLAIALVTFLLPKDNTATYALILTLIFLIGLSSAVI